MLFSNLYYTVSCAFAQLYFISDCSKKTPHKGEPFIWLRTLILIPMQPGSRLVGATGCSPSKVVARGSISSTGVAFKTLLYICHMRIPQETHKRDARPDCKLCISVLNRFIVFWPPVATASDISYFCNTLRNLSKI